MPTLFRRKNRSGFPRAFGGAIAVFALLAAQAASAATAYFAPSSGIREIGATFTVSVNVSSPDQAINAADVVVGFPTDRLQVLSTSKGGSIISFWVEEPSFSNADGTVRLQGVIPNPGWKGSGGRLLSITFRAKSEGSASLRFISGSVLANDGQGTNVLQSFGAATFSIVAASQAPTVEGGEPPPAPVITAANFPDQDAWYQPRDREADGRRERRQLSFGRRFEYAAGRRFRGKCRDRHHQKSGRRDLVLPRTRPQRARLGRRVALSGETRRHSARDRLDAGSS